MKQLFLLLILSFSFGIGFNSSSSYILPSSVVTSSYYEYMSSNRALNITSKEIIKGGDFASSSGWTVGTGWVVSGGSASHSGSIAGVIKNTVENELIVGREYVVTLEISNWTNGHCLVVVGGAFGEEISGNGIHMFKLTALTTTNTYIQGGDGIPVANNFVADIESFSIKEVSLTAESAKFSKDINANSFISSLSVTPNVIEGKLYFNSTNNHFYGYNGSAWVQLDN